MTMTKFPRDVFIIEDVDIDFDVDDLWKALAAPFQQTLKHYNTGNLCSSGKVIC
jgi:hypothetical protein